MGLELLALTRYETLPLLFAWFVVGRICVVLFEERRERRRRGRDD